MEAHKNFVRTHMNFMYILWIFHTITKADIFARKEPITNKFAYVDIKIFYHLYFAAYHQCILICNYKYWTIYLLEFPNQKYRITHWCVCLIIFGRKYRYTNINVILLPFVRNERYCHTANTCVDVIYIVVHWYWRE